MCSKELLSPKKNLYNVVVSGSEMPRLEDAPAGESILYHKVETAHQRTWTNQGEHGSLRSMGGTKLQWDPSNYFPCQLEQSNP